MAEGWRVTGTQPSTAPDANGTYRPVVRVDFQTDGGSRGHVDVPYDEYSAEKARTMIEPFAAELMATERL